MELLPHIAYGGNLGSLRCSFLVAEVINISKELLRCFFALRADPEEWLK